MSEGANAILQQAALRRLLTGRCRDLHDTSERAHNGLRKALCPNAVNTDNIFIIPVNNLFCCCLIGNQYSAYIYIP